MVRFFITLYHFLNRHKFLLYASLLAWIGIMTYCATQVKFEENITSIFPRKGEEDYTVRVFDNLRIKDKIIVMFSLRDTVATDTRELAACADAYDQALMKADGGTHIAATMSSIEGKTVGEVSRFVRQYLPLFLSPADFARFDTITTPEGIAASMSRSYMQLLSPIGSAIKENVAADPVGLSGSAMTLLRDLQGDTSYEMADGHIFSADGSTLLLFISPKFGSGYTGKNEILIREIESTRDSLSVLYPDVNIEYFGGPSVAVYNARQIKRDTLLTLSVALLIIVLFILSVFKRKVSILLMLPTVGFGALFALTVIYLVQGSVSSIAIGIGSVILGISLSYSIHMLAHQNHVKSVEQLIEELTLPLTIGSFTTIGAFFALIFTSSELLHDLGLFASMTLVGTTLFCLIYLPHFLRGDAEIKQNALLRGIERINAYPYDRNKYIVTGIILLAIVCSFFAQRVTFDSDMMALSFEPPHLKKSEERLEGMVDPAHQTILFVSVGKDFDEAAAAHPELEYLYGFECDWYEGCEDNIRRWSAGAQVRLGSVHWLGPIEGGAWIDDASDQRIWRELGPDEVWRRYVDTWCRACACDLFDTMAHPDLAMRFANEGFAPTIDLRPLWDEMAACARDTGKRVELSTAGWRKGVGDYYPAQGLLERFLRAGVPITVGSDGHAPGDICDGIARAYDHAARGGYRTVEVPRADGSWEAMPIAD